MEKDNIGDVIKLGIHVSADSMVEQRSGQNFYQGKVALDASLLKDNQVELKPRTLLDYLLSPIIHSIERGMKET